jgi:transcriptional regulator with XRE-family HTH domain
MSRRIAETQGQQDIALSHARLIQIENGSSTPSVYKLFALSAIYGVSVTELVQLYVALNESGRHHHEMMLERTHLIDEDADSEERRIELPIALKEGISSEVTSLLCDVATVWGHVPLGWLKHLNLRRGRYGMIGLSDLTMSPLLRPGSFVQIDDTQRFVRSAVYTTEFDRPIFFVETRTEYLCSWCELRGRHLISIPHPLSPCSTREFAYPNEAEIIGRVTAVAARLTHAPAGRGRRTDVTDER